MCLEMSPSPSELASAPPSINSELGTYPPVPLPLIREGGIMVSEGASAPSGTIVPLALLRKGVRGIGPQFTIY